MFDISLQLITELRQNGPSENVSTCIKLQCEMSNYLFGLVFWDDIYEKKYIVYASVADQQDFHT